MSKRVVVASVVVAAPGHKAFGIWSSIDVPRTIQVTSGGNGFGGGTVGVG